MSNFVVRDYQFGIPDQSSSVLGFLLGHRFLFALLQRHWQRQAEAGKMLRHELRVVIPESDSVGSCVVIHNLQFCEKIPPGVYLLL